MYGVLDNGFALFLRGGRFFRIGVLVLIFHRAKPHTDGGGGGLTLFQHWFILTEYHARVMISTVLVT
jgi:hypothetical protein